MSILEKDYKSCDMISQSQYYLFLNLKLVNIKYGKNEIVIGTCIIF